MKQTINFTQFADAFKAIRPDNFSYAGLKALYDYLEQYEEDTGGEVELDVIALCCEYTEYENIDKFTDEHIDIEPTIEAVEERTTTIRIEPFELTGSFIIQDF